MQVHGYCISTRSTENDKVISAYSRTRTFPKICFICFNESPLKMMKNAFYFKFLS